MRRNVHNMIVDGLSLASPHTSARPSNAPCLAPPLINCLNIIFVFHRILIKSHPASVLWCKFQSIRFIQRTQS
jgi:hypothetical protein